MKRIIAILLCLSFVLTMLAACTPSDDNTPDDTDNNVSDSENDGANDSGENTDDSTVDSTEDSTDVVDPETPDVNTDDSEPVLNLEGIEAIRYSNLGEDDVYTIAGGDKLSSYFEEPFESFLGVCKYYEDNSWELYSYTVKNGNHFATWTKSSRLAHLYWIECEQELNLVSSQKGADTLPPKTPEVTTGDVKTSVTQIQSTEINGMGYVTQLADGSFIIHDGGPAHRADELWNTLVALNGGKTTGIVIRAWLITHGHGDHYPCVTAFADKYAKNVTVEYFLISPVETSGNYLAGSGITTDVKKFDGAKLCYVHTGMTFNFCNVKFEMLFTGDELWIAEPYRDEGLGEAMNQNNSSIVSRIYTDDYSAIFLGDSSEEVALRMALYYGDYLKSDMCQIAHHGVEDFPLIAYRFINASILWYPCSQSLYDNKGRDKDVRDALKKSQYTKEIILHDKSRETREFGLYKD